MIQISESEVDRWLDVATLIGELEKGFANEAMIPNRQHLSVKIENDRTETTNNTLLIMPAWRNSNFLGVKIVTIAPENTKLDLPAIQGSYQLFDVRTGVPLAIMDAKKLTARRTAATSALASKFLSRANSTTMLLIGTGALAPELIRAHCKVRQIEKVYIWGRRKEKADELRLKLSDLSQDIQIVRSIADAISMVDIVSCATLSPTPLVCGEFLVPGQHIDLVGAYKPDMRESDDEAIRRSRIFSDTDTGIFESGDLAQPIEDGVISIADVQANLFQLCRHEREGRKDSEEITLFKSVGFALEDLIAAGIIWNSIQDSDDG